MSDTEIRNEIEEIKILLILLLRANKVKNPDIAQALGISESRISQILDRKKYSRKEAKNG